VTLTKSDPWAPVEPAATGGTPSPAPEPAASRPGPPVQPRSSGMNARQVVATGLLALVGVVVAFAVVIYGIGPLTHGRDQRTLLAAERVAISNAVNDNQGLHRGSLPTQPPVAGASVGILAIPSIGLQQVVVEGVGPNQTVTGPGHVPGTAGLGQPGNSAVVGRRAGFGGPFGSLDQLRPGDHIVTATTEGQSLYVVRSVRHLTLVTAGGASAATTAGATTATTAAATTARRPASVGKVSADVLYGPSAHDQLTLVTSGSGMPWNTDQVLAVTARLDGRPYAPSPQESRSPSQQGNSGNGDALASLALALLALAAALVGTVALYRRISRRSAYLLSTAPLLALTVLAAEAASRLLPAWS
jgi:sortase A